MSETTEQWVTAIGRVDTDDVLIRGYPLSELVGNITFVDACFLVLTGELPPPGGEDVLDAIFVSVIDHGISPSSMIVRMLASCGTPIQAALAGGTSSIADWHGGAGEALAERLHQVVAGSRGGSPEEEREALRAAIAELVSEYTAVKRRFEGFGHPQHSEGDPRVNFLVDLARSKDVAGPHTEALEMLAAEIEQQTGRHLVANVNGAIAALLLDLGFPWQSVRGFIIAPRAIGLTAHFVEERQQGGKWRHAAADTVSYTGKERRSLPDDWAD
jgi:citrate synthase